MKFSTLVVLFATVSGVAATSVKSPVEKVVKLLEELKANLLRDQKVEQQIYDRYACWCETRSGEKASSIMLRESDIYKLTQEVLELKGKVAVLAKEISDLTTKIAENEATQKDSTNVRTKENGEWQKEKAEYEEAIDALERAIKVLSGAGTKTGLLQGGTDAASMRAMHRLAVNSVRSVVSVLPTKADLAPQKLAMIESFVQELQPVAQDASASYAPQSATVQGILKDMYDEFTSDLEEITQKEASQQKDYEEAIAKAHKELNGFVDEGGSDVDGLVQIVAKKEAELADTSQQLADTIQELDDTKKEQEAEIAFFDKMKGECKAKHEEWELRKSQRLEEIEGIEKALEILTSDEARALFAKAIKPGMETSFLQIASDFSMGDAATKAYNVLKTQAKKSHSLRLAALAATIRTNGHGHFDKVIKKIDEMIQTLKDEEQEDIKQRDWCKDEYHLNSEEQEDIK